MTRQEIIDELKGLQGDTDIEIAHSRADRLLCEWLIQQGYGDIVEEWDHVQKWYA